MAEDKEFSEIQEFISELKAIKSEISHILDENNEKALSRAAEYYPVKINLLLTERNILSVRSIFPFIDLAAFQNRKQNIDLIDLNLKKENAELLWDVIRRIDQELEVLSRLY